MKGIIKNELEITQEERKIISTFINTLESVFKLDITDNTHELAEIMTAIQVESPNAYLSDLSDDFNDIHIKYTD